MGRETPEEFWQRIRKDRAPSARPPARSPGAVRERASGQSAASPARGPDRESPALSEGQESSRRTQAESEEPSTGDLVKQLTEQTKTLVKQEMRLAQAELQEKGKKVGIGAGMLGIGGLVAFFGAATLIAALVLALATALAPWLSALIVGVVLLAVAGGAALVGKKQIEQATPPVPQQTVETVKQDVDHVKARAKR